MDSEKDARIGTKSEQIGFCQGCGDEVLESTAFCYHCRMTRKEMWEMKGTYAPDFSI